MTLVIAFRPETARGRRILNDLELRFDIWPMQVVGDGTRRYGIDQDGAEVDGFGSARQCAAVGSPVWRFRAVSCGPGFALASETPSVEGASKELRLGTK